LLGGTGTLACPVRCRHSKGGQARVPVPLNPGTRQTDDSLPAELLNFISDDGMLGKRRLSGRSVIQISGLFPGAPRLEATFPFSSVKGLLFLDWTIGCKELSHRGSVRAKVVTGTQGPSLCRIARQSPSICFLHNTSLWVWLSTRVYIFINI